MQYYNTCCGIFCLHYTTIKAVEMAFPGISALWLLPCAIESCMCIPTWLHWCTFLWLRTDYEWEIQFRTELLSTSFMYPLLGKFSTVPVTFETVLIMALVLSCIYQYQDLLDNNTSILSFRGKKTQFEAIQKQMFFISFQCDILYGQVSTENLLWIILTKQALLQMVTLTSVL